MSLPVRINRPHGYLDTASSAQTPDAVLETMDDVYKHHYANVHRGLYPLAEDITQKYEDARTAVQKFLNANESAEIIFTKSTTESLNLVARTFGESMKKGDAVLLSVLEHHSNSVPWLQLKERNGIDVRWIGIDEQGSVKMDDLEQELQKGDVKIVCITGYSNVTGTQPDLKKIGALAHEHGALLCIDAAQLVAHKKIDVQEWDVDFLAFSGHKLYGPTGMGVLYGKKDLLKKLPPFLGGGNMIDDVTKEGFVPTSLPNKFEAGTPPIVEAIGLKAAIKWLSQYPWGEIAEYEHMLIDRLRSQLSTIEGLKILPSPNASSVLSFTIDSIHPHDIAAMLGAEGISVRAGHHCAKVLHKELGITASVRVSVGIYNTIEEIDAVAPALKKIMLRLRSA